MHSLVTTKTMSVIIDRQSLIRLVSRSSGILYSTEFVGQERARELDSLGKATATTT